jgi:hypothetical protein
MEIGLSRRAQAALRVRIGHPSTHFWSLFFPPPSLAQGLDQRRPSTLRQAFTVFVFFLLESIY